MCAQVVQTLGKFDQGVWFDLGSLVEGAARKAFILNDIVYSKDSPMSHVRRIKTPSLG